MLMLSKKALPVMGKHYYTKLTLTSHTTKIITCSFTDMHVLWRLASTSLMPSDA
jgi:hypothetical protein